MNPLLRKRKTVFTGLVTNIVRPNPAKRKRKKYVPKPKQSAFVRFFNKIEKAGPDHPIHGESWEAWTQKIHRDMEAAGTWPTGEQEFKIDIVVEYVGRLMTIFWKAVEIDDYENFEMIELLFSGSAKPTYDPYRGLFRKIYRHMRKWGIRKKLFVLGDRKFYMACEPMYDCWIEWGYERWHTYKFKKPIEPVEKKL